MAQETCKCGAVYQVKWRDSPTPSTDHKDCVECGQRLAGWYNQTRWPEYTLIGSRQDDQPSHQAPSEQVIDFSRHGLRPSEITARDFIEWYHSLNPELQKIVNQRLQELGRKREAISVAEANALNESNCHMAYEPQIRRAKARSYVAWCNNVVHEAPWTKGERRSLGGINIVLELAELAHRAHGLRYESGISRMSEFPPRRFRWVYSEGGETDDCVLVLDLQTQCLAVWPHWLG
jgi:hypothetical protein